MELTNNLICAVNYGAEIFGEQRTSYIFCRFQVHLFYVQFYFPTRLTGIISKLYLTLTIIQRPRTQSLLSNQKAVTPSKAMKNVKL